MRTLSALAALAITCSAIIASPPAMAANAAPEQISLCTNLANLARSIMEGRQSGADAADVTEIVEKVDSVPVRDYGRRMVALAYAKELRPQAERANAAREFRSMAYDTCIERIVTQPVAALKAPEEEAAIIRLVRP